MRQGGKAGARATEYAGAVAKIDKAFFSFAENLGTILDERELASSPFAQCLVMFNTAWVTTSMAPIAAAGVMGQPLGRAMVATASSHASFAAIKFTMAIFAMTKLPIVPSATNATIRRRYGPSAGLDKPKRISRKPTIGRPQMLFPRRRAHAHRGASAVAAGGGDNDKRVTIQVRRAAKTVPRVWLMVVTAVGGPAVGAVVSAVTHRLGHIAVPAALSSVSRGCVLGALAAGLLCYGGAGTWLVARWAVFQGVFGALFAAFVSPSALMFIVLCNYYASAAAFRREGRDGNGGGGSAGRSAGTGGGTRAKKGQGRGKGSDTDDEKK